MGRVKQILSKRYIWRTFTMIFITVGTTNKGFDRLLMECDRIAQETGKSFFAQTGSSKYNPKNMPFKKWLTNEEMKFFYYSATSFIIHGGFGTLSETLKTNKPIIVVPRKFEDGEAVNDQMDLAIKLHSLGFIHCIKNLSDLEEILFNENKIKLKPFSLVTTIPSLLNTYISELTKDV